MIFKSNVMNLNFKEAVCYLTFKEFDNYDFFKHAYSTRLGGISNGEFKSLNFGFNTKDNTENINQNYDIFCECFGVKKENTVITSQIHGDYIKCVQKINEFTCYENTDGLITNEPGIMLATFHADCLAVYMIDIKKKVIGLAHAGWRGTVQCIAEKLAQKFITEYCSSKGDIICALGPGIGGCCFEVSDEVLEKFYKLNIPRTYVHQKNKINLAEVNKQLLIQFGLNPENIIKSDICTMCNWDMLYSYRATQGKTGRNCAFICLN